MDEQDEPFGWWGWHWQAPVPMSIMQIIEADSTDTNTMAVLWAMLSRRASILVAAEPPMAVNRPPHARYQPLRERHLWPGGAPLPFRAYPGAGRGSGVRSQESARDTQPSVLSPQSFARARCASRAALSLGPQNRHLRALLR